MALTHRQKTVLENRERLKPIVESIIFLGRQIIPLRGNFDSGKLFNDEDSTRSESIITNQGNFREILKYRVLSGDKVLEDHLKSLNARATYISPIIQNDLIKCCKHFIMNKIIDEVKENKYFSIIFDETTDISHTSQMSLILRYVHKGIIKENFIAFIDFHKHAFSSNNYKDQCNNDSEDDEVVDINSTILEPKLTGEILGKTVVSILKELNLDCLNCVGIATDGCSVMTSTLRGAVQFVQSYAPHAVYSPCSNHSLNLSISKLSSVQAIRNSVGLIKEVISFFNMSSKRNYVLLTVLKENPRLKSLCETRWIERNDSIIIFQSTLTYILEALTSISSWHEQDSSSKA